MVHGKNRISYWIDRRLTGLAGPEYDVAISLGLPCEPEDCQYGESRVKAVGRLWLLDNFSARNSRASMFVTCICCRRVPIASMRSARLSL